MAKNLLTSKNLPNVNETLEEAKSKAASVLEDTKGQIAEAKGKLADAKALADKAKAAAEGGIGGLVEGAVGAAAGAVDSLESGIGNLTDELPGGLGTVGKDLLTKATGLDVLKSSVGDLKRIKNVYDDFSSRISNVSSSASKRGTLSPNADSNPDNVIARNDKGQLKTYVFPSDYVSELCFRLDFVRFFRQSVFQDSVMTPLRTFILPLPKTIQNNQGVGYSQQELGTFGEVEARLRTGDNEGTPGAMQQVGEGIASTALRSLLNTDAGRVVSAGMGFIPNPNLSNIFTGVPFRTFRFDISLVARTQDESEDLLYILEMLKAQSLPKRSASFAALDYPNECFISFSEAGSKWANLDREYKTPLDRIFKFQRCVVTDVEIIVNPQGDQSFFNDYAPTEITLAMTFMEQQISTADMYDSRIGPADALGNKAKNAWQNIADANLKTDKQPPPDSGTGSTITNFYTGYSRTGF